MRLSVITITCRENPRLPDMAKTLSASLARAPAGTELEWLIVDEHGSRRALLVRDSLLANDLFKVVAVAPFPSPQREASEKAPAHNSSRQAGLQKATGSYVVFLNDCALVTQDWVSVALDCAAQNLGWRCKAHEVNDIAIPANGIIRMKDHHDLLRPIPASTVPGACWGAPYAAFEKIEGFDLAYDGEDKGHDLDAVIRLSRIGVTFVTTERAFCVRLRRTRTKTEISTRKEVFNGTRNLMLIHRLNADPARILPLGPGAEAVAPAPTPPAPRPVRVALSSQNYPRLAGTAQSAAKRPIRVPPARAAAPVPPPADHGDDGPDDGLSNGAGNLESLTSDDVGDLGDELAGLMD